MVGSTNSQPLGIILGVGSEEGLQGVVARNDEASEVGEELAAEIEDDKEEVESSETDGSVSLGNARLLLQVAEGGVFAELGRLVSERTQRQRDGEARRHALQGVVLIYLLVERSKIVLRFLLCRSHRD